MGAQMGDMSFATKLRTLVMQLVEEGVEKFRPRPRYGIVYSINRPGKKVEVILNGDIQPVTVNVGAIQPRTTGQVVRVEGIGFDRYITDVVGGVVWHGDIQISASQVASGVFDPARMAHIRSDSSTRAWFTTNVDGGWGGNSTALVLSPPTDAAWSERFVVRVDNVTKFALDADGKMTAGIVPADRIDKFTSGPTYTNLMGAADSPTQGWAFQLNNSAGTAGLIHDNAWKVQWNTSGSMTVGTVPTTRLSGLVGYSNLPHIVANPSPPTPYVIFGTDQNLGYDTATTALRMVSRSGSTQGERFALYDAARKVLIAAQCDSVGDYMTMIAAYTRTTTTAANLVAFTTAGAIGRSTSLRAAKSAIEDAPESWAERVWNLRPRTWFDKGDADLLAEALGRQEEGEEIEWDEVPVAPLRRIPGFVAEEVEEAGLEEFLVRDETGALTGLAYDRFSAALLLAMKDEREKRIATEARVEQLETQVGDIESKLNSLVTQLGVDF